jgi:hypothetical protein
LRSVPEHAGDRSARRRRRTARPRAVVTGGAGVLVGRHVSLTRIWHSKTASASITREDQLLFPSCRRPPAGSRAACTRRSCGSGGTRSQQFLVVQHHTSGSRGGEVEGAVVVAAAAEPAAEPVDGQTGHQDQGGPGDRPGPQRGPTGSRRPSGPRGEAVGPRSAPSPARRGGRGPPAAAPRGRRHQRVDQLDRARLGAHRQVRAHRAAGRRGQGDSGGGQGVRPLGAHRSRQRPAGGHDLPAHPVLLRRRTPAVGWGPGRSSACRHASTLPAPIGSPPVHDPATGALGPPLRAVPGAPREPVR